MDTEDSGGAFATFARLYGKDFAGILIGTALTGIPFIGTAFTGICFGLGTTVGSSRESLPARFGGGCCP